MLKVESLGPNKTLLTLEGKQVFVSYSTPVAAWIQGRGYIKTSTKWSRTTSKHITQWLGGVNAEEVDQEVLNSLLD